MIFLKRCPFCGSKMWIENKANITYFKCLFCSAVINFECADDEIEAIQHFNRRENLLR